MRHLQQTSVYDVGAFIQNQLGPVTAYRLQKLVYYAQAWSLAWDDKPLFSETIKAWVDGPVCPQLWKQGVSEGSADALTEDEQETVLAVLDVYGRLADKELIDLTHRESPWRNARRGLGSDERGHAPITWTALREYYGPAANDSLGKRIPDEVRRGIALLVDMPDDELQAFTKVDPVEGQAVIDWLETGETDPWLRELEEEEF